jgi:hypothetical protein
MEDTDQRRHPRVGTCNLISFSCIDSDGTLLRHGMGRALDISQSGLLLESGHPIETASVSLMSTDPQNRLIEITGRVVHSRRNPSGGFLTGVRFGGSREENVRFATELIKTFHYRRTTAQSPAGPAQHPEPGP